MIKQPLFLKVFFVLLITGILVLSLIAVHLTLLSNQSETPLFVRQGLKTYTESLAREIGDPPNYERARQLANDLNIGIRIRTKAGVWQSSSTLQPVKEASYRIVKRGIVYSFFLRTDNPSAPLIRQLLIIIFGLCVVLAVSYTVIRWLFRPLAKILAGVRAISEGDLSYRITTTPNSEFEYVGTAFNQMTSAVTNMLKAREQLLLDLSHDLRSPMTRMQVSTEFVADADLKKSLKDDLSDMENLIHGILDAARLGSSVGAALRLVELDLDEHLRTLCKRLGTAAPGIHYYPEVHAKTPYTGDWGFLQRAFSNLIENALKFSSHQSRSVEVHLSADDQGCQVKIKDFGVGIPASEQALIFEPFYRVDKSRTPGVGGYGLGLSLTKKIIEAHSGNIIIESKEGYGATFTVTLPHHTPALARSPTTT